MAQFDVYRVRGDRLVVDCQANLLSSLPTRFVVPLRPKDQSVMERLTPVLEIEGRGFSLFTPLAGAIEARSLSHPIVSLLDHEYEIKQALDMLIVGF